MNLNLIPISLWLPALLQAATAPLPPALGPHEPPPRHPLPVRRGGLAQPRRRSPGARLGRHRTP